MTASGHSVTSNGLEERSSISRMWLFGLMGFMAYPRANDFMVLVQSNNDQSKQYFLELATTYEMCEQNLEMPDVVDSTSGYVVNAHYQDPLTIPQVGGSPLELSTANTIDYIPGVVQGAHGVLRATENPEEKAKVINAHFQDDLAVPQVGGSPPELPYYFRMIEQIEKVLNVVTAVDCILDLVVNVHFYDFLTVPKVGGSPLELPYEQYPDCIPGVVQGAHGELQATENPEEEAKCKEISPRQHTAHLGPPRKHIG